MRRDFAFLLLALWLTLASIHADDEILPSAKAYIEEALKVMQEHFLHKEKIDWPTLKQEALSQAAGAQTAVDTYPAIRFALAKLGDHHSYLQLTPDLSRQENSRKTKLANPSAMPAPPARKQSFPFPSPFRMRRVPEGAMVAGSTCPVAQIVIPLFSSQQRKDIDDYAAKVQSVIADDWRAAGVDVEQVAIPQRLAQDKVYRGTFPGFEMVHQAGGLSGLKNLYSSEAVGPENNYLGKNRSRYMSRELDTLIDAVFVTIPRPERQQCRYI